MPALARILLPIDFSGRCAGAARYATVLAARFGSQVTVLHVLPPPHYEFSALEVGGSVLNELFATRAAQTAQELENYLADELAGLNVSRVLLEGDPARKIVAYAHDNGFDLILMPTHGYGPFRRFILGSVAAKVLHDADCPVWTGVHMEETPASAALSLTSVVAAVDLGEQSLKALQWAAWFAGSCGARLAIVHATPSLEARGGEYFDPEWRKHLSAQAGEEIQKLQDRAGTQAEVLIDSGDAPMVVCSGASRLQASVLVIGRGSAAGIFGRMRTNAYAIIRQSGCPVVSV